MHSLKATGGLVLAPLESGLGLSLGSVSVSVALALG